MTLRGDDTGDDRLFTDTIAGDAELKSFAERISVVGDAGLTDLQISGTINLTDGRTIPLWFDLAEPFTTEVLAEKLQRKSSTIIGEASAAIWNLYPCFGQLGARDIAAALVAASADWKT